MVGCPPGTKYDSGKPRYDLIDPACELELAKILTTGAEKYADDNWKQVPDPERRYYAAMRRHLEADRMGETIDRDSGELHLSHAFACLHFLLWFRMEKEIGRWKGISGTLLRTSVEGKSNYFEHKGRPGGAVGCLMAEIRLYRQEIDGKRRLIRDLRLQEIRLDMPEWKYWKKGA